jgi:ubiquinone/menaquinone biosynthesis C-methylase UbiE
MTMQHLHGKQRAPAPATEGRTIRWARFYDILARWGTLGRITALRRRTLALAGIQAGEAVLDVGCGTGDLAILARRLAGPAGTVAGIDAAPEMIAFARQKASRAGVAVDLRTAVAEALPFGDESFDVVLSTLVVHHLPGDLAGRAFAEMGRVLRPGGRLVIVDMKRPTGLLARLWLTAAGHLHMSHGVQDLPPMLLEAGFTELRGGNAALGVLGYIRGRKV